MALDDLAGIAAHIGQSDPDAAERVVLMIQLRTRHLRDFPLSGPRLDLGNTRKLSIVRYPFIVAYTFEAESVLILRVRHASQDHMI